MRTEAHQSVMRRCRSLLALPSLFSSSSSSPNASFDLDLEPEPDLYAKQLANNDDTYAARTNSPLKQQQQQQVSSQTQQSSSAKKFFKSLLQTAKTSSRDSTDSQSYQANTNSNNNYAKLKLLKSAKKQQRRATTAITRHQLSQLASQNQAAAADPATPEAIDWLLADLFRRGPATLGVFRKSPNARHCRELKQRLETCKSPADLELDSYQVVVVASVFKEWLRSMPDCLLTSRLYSHWVDIAKLISNSPEDTPSLECLKIVCQLLARLGDNKLQLLTSLICVLSEIASQSEVNKMSPINLGVCVGQSLLVENQHLEMDSRSAKKSRASSPIRNSAISCVPQLVAFLINNATILFGDQLESSARRYTELASRLSPRPPSAEPADDKPDQCDQPQPERILHEQQLQQDVCDGHAREQLNQRQILTPSTMSPPVTPIQHVATARVRHMNLKLDNLDDEISSINISHTNNKSHDHEHTHHHHHRHHHQSTTMCPIDTSTPSPSDSGRCTTSESSASSASSSASSDSSFQMASPLHHPMQMQAAAPPVSCASDLARRELAARNWCLCYYTPWEEPSRSHVMSLRDYYLSLQLEHQRQQEQMRKIR